MEPELLIRLVLLPLLLMASAFFSGSEVAFFSLNRLQIDRLKKSSAAGARVAALLSTPQRLLVTLYIGNELVNVAMSSVTTVLAYEVFGSEGMAIALGVGAFMLLSFGEVTPKTFAHHASEKFALTAAYPLSLFMFVIYPVQVVVTWVADIIVSGLGGGKVSAENSILTEDEIKTLVEEGADIGVIDEGEKEMIHNVFDLGEVTVRDIMTPRTEILALEVDTPVKEAWDIMANSQFARAPVYRDSIDNIEGILFKKDLLKYDYPPDETLSLKNMLREAYIAPETMSANELLRELKKRKNHLAIAMDEYGGVQGVVTLDDIIGELLGDAADNGEKHDGIEKLSEDTYLLDGAIPLEEFNEVIGHDIAHEEIETIGGYVFHLLGRAPKLKESIEAEGLRFIVTGVKRHRITELKVTVMAGHDEAEDK